MSTSPGRATSQVRSVRRQTARRRRRMRHHLFSIRQPAARRKENVFWRQLEARDEGRLAQEADHLFDTSYTWAA